MTRKSARVSDWRVGIDVVVVDEVTATVARFGDRYLQRVFTPSEIAACQTASGLSDLRLAAYFAAKEATVKVLRPTDARPDFRSIEVARSPRGTFAIHLSGEAARCAEDAGIVQLSASLTHVSQVAAAVVVAHVAQSADPDTPRVNRELR